jgi:signal transduction histidine kinase
MKPGKSRWFVFGAGVGLGLSLAVTSPSRPVNGNTETHRKGVGGLGERETLAVNRFEGLSAGGALAEACRRRDDLLAMLAHELRSPLNAIQDALALLGKSDAAGHGSWRRLAD